MGGWNIFYGLLNFAILAAALYFIGWKLVVKMFKSRRDRIADELEQAKQAKEKGHKSQQGGRRAVAAIENSVAAIENPEGGTGFPEGGIGRGGGRVRGKGKD